MSHKQNKKLRRNAKKLKEQIESNAIESLLTQIRGEPWYKRMRTGWRLTDLSPGIRLQMAPVGISVSQGYSERPWAVAAMLHPAWWDRRVHQAGWIVTLCGVRIGWRRG